MTPLDRAVAVCCLILAAVSGLGFAVLHHLDKE